jgi:hypothetical protein
MRKFVKYIIVIYCLLWYGCTQNNSNKDEKFYVSQSQIDILADTIYRTILDYVKYHDFDDDIVYQLYIDQNPDSTTLYLSYTQYNDEVFVFTPSGFTKIDDLLIVLYSPEHAFYKADNEFREKLLAELRKKSLKNKDIAPSIREHKVWFVTKKRGDTKMLKGEINICPYSSIGLEINR